MPRKRDDAGQCLDAAMTIAAERGWVQVSIASIAEATGLSLPDVRRVCPGRSGVIALLADRADEAMLGAVDEDWAGESVRDRLFGLLMTRFDFLKGHRDGLKAMAAAIPSDPCLAGIGYSHGKRSMALALDVSGVSTSGIRGALRVRALTATYALVARSFMDDESDDLSRTMAALDKRLGGLERLAERVAGQPSFRTGNSTEES